MLGGIKMKVSFVIGTLIALLNILLALLAKDWKIAFVLSGSVSVITLVITSMLRNAMLIFNRGFKASKGDRNSFLEAEKIMKLISAFGFPNIVLTVILFFRLYGINYIMKRI